MDQQHEKRAERLRPAWRVEKERPLPTPTKFMPGTPEKVEVLAQRRARGEHLWHPDDPTIFSQYGRLRTGIPLVIVDTELVNRILEDDGADMEVDE